MVSSARATTARPRSRMADRSLTVFTLRLCLLMSVGQGGVLLGQQAPTTAPATTISAEDRAGDDAFQRFVDEVLGLRLSEGRMTVAALLAIPETHRSGSDAPAAGIPERELRRILLSRCQRGGLRPSTGGGVEVEVWLPTPQVSEILQQLAARLPQINSARVVLHAEVGPSVTGTGHYLPDGRARDPRPGWRHCTQEQITQTILAAELDLRQRLLAMIADLHTPGGKSLRLYLAERPRWREAIARRVQAVRPGEAMLEPTGVCRVSVAIARKDLAALLQAAANDSQERELPAVDPLVTSLPAEALLIEGLAVPPPTPMLSVSTTTAPADPGRPEWAGGFRKARATGLPPPGLADESLRREIATRAARLEAGRLLWMEIESLPLESGTVGDRLAGHPQVARAAAAIDTLFIPMSNAEIAPDGSVTLTVGVRLEAVWDVLRSLH